MVLIRGRKSERGAARCRAAPWGREAGAPRVLKALECALSRVGDLEERVELRELEQCLEVVVQIREAELPALLADLLRERHEHPEAGAVDVARLAEVDEKLALAPLQLVEHLLFQLLPVADDQLAFHVDDDDVVLLLDREAHVLSPSGTIPCCVFGAPAAWRAVMAATLIMSSETAPRERSLHGRASPWRIGPTALAPASRCTSLYAMLPASSVGKTSTLARPATGLAGAFRAATEAASAASPCNSPSTRSSGARSRTSPTAARTASTLEPRPLPRVLNERSATRGSSPTMRRRSAA